MERSGKKRIRNGTRVLIGPIMRVIPRTSFLRAEFMEMKEMSSHISGGSPWVRRFAMVRAQAASVHIPKSALLVQGSRSSSKPSRRQRSFCSPSLLSDSELAQRIEMITEKSTYVPS